ncbi:MULTISPECIES: tetratricopeptide repeat protein [unclassified Thioalkalivibrio]|uniref:tetratricopeptide repeat protein n=1 Tax=unclassified Thioalkalivibrio TaxID=2621013 RepID=UPI00035CDE4C|nr:MULTISPECIES: tetratricopeptide repeat protein [unclassified Thioalkalivibrio]
MNKRSRTGRDQEAPIAFKLPLGAIDTSNLPLPGSPDYGEALRRHVSAMYKSEGYSLRIAVKEDYVYGVGVRPTSMHPQEYVEGLLKSGFYSDALPFLQAMSLITPSPDLLYNQGLALASLGRPGESIEPLTVAAQMSPNDPAMRTALALSFLKLNKAEAAEMNLREAIRVQPDYHWANRNLAALLSQQGSLEEGERLFRAALEAQPNEPHSLFGLAQNLAAQGSHRTEDAASAYKDLIREHPDHKLAEEARRQVNRMMEVHLRSDSGGGLRPDAVMYMRGALERFEGMDRNQILAVMTEIAEKGEQGIEVGNADKRYRLDALPGEFTGLHLLCLLHVSAKMMAPDLDTGSGLDPEYEAAIGQPVEP